MSSSVSPHRSAVILLVLLAANVILNANIIIHVPLLTVSAGTTFKPYFCLPSWGRRGDILPVPAPTLSPQSWKLSLRSCEQGRLGKWVVWSERCLANLHWLTRRKLKCIYFCAYTSVAHAWVMSASLILTQVQRPPSEVSSPTQEEGSMASLLFCFVFSIYCVDEY